jgi:hypothetical protein
VALREILDENATLWQVFDVHPATEAEGAVLTGTFVHGWLCFLSEKGRRRITPIPEGWEQMTDHALRRLLSVAPPTGEIPRPAK